MAAMKSEKPDLALGTTPLVQAAKQFNIPAIYFTNMVSARPLFGAAGIGALAGIVAAQTKGAERFARMGAFFDGVGTPEAAGYGWRGVPDTHPEAKAKFRKMREAKARAEAAVGT
jgi:chlorophyllide a reductase subunit Y